MTKTAGVREIKIHEDENFDTVMIDIWGRSFFLSKSQPKGQFKDKVVGVISRPMPLQPGQKRRRNEKRWVVSKPSRQIGAKPRERANISLDSDLKVQADKLADEKFEGNFSALVEAALQEFLLAD